MTTLGPNPKFVLAIAAMLGAVLTLGACSTTSTATGWNEQHAGELLRRGQADQAVRSVDFAEMNNEERNAAAERMVQVDRENTAWLEATVADAGWPTANDVGDEAATAAFLIVQHADHRPDFQAAMLPELEDAARAGEIPSRQVAYLTDRVRVAQRRPQLYGTQYYVFRNAAGAAVADEQGRLQYLLPIVEDIDNLDARRSAMGLGPWIEYESRMAESQERAPQPLPRLWDGREPVDPQSY